MAVIAAGGAEIAVRDRGPGIPEAALERVFEPFYRLHPARSWVVDGSGLGLAIARNVQRAHGGDVMLANMPDGGLLALLLLPVAPGTSC